MSLDKNHSKEGARVLLEYFYKGRKWSACCLAFQCEVSIVGGDHLLCPGTPGVLMSGLSSLYKSSAVYRYEYLGRNLEGKCVEMGFITTIQFLYLTPNCVTDSLGIFHLCVHTEE